MSQENVDVVRHYVELLSRFMAAARANPGPVNETPFIDEFFECLDPEVEWHWPLTDEAFRGREAMVRAATDFLEAVDDWRIEVDELVDAGGDQVFAVQRISARGKGSGTPFEQNIFTALRVRDGKVWRIHDYTERAEALKAVGLAK
jgi:ketosteroid isomerase-like protein